MTNSTVEPHQRNLWQIIFISPTEARLRAGWRLLIQTLLLLILLIGMTIPVGIIILILGGDTSGTLVFAVSILVELVAITASVLLCRVLLDRRSIASLGLKPGRQTVPDLLAGILISSFIMGLIYTTLWLLGWLHFDGFAWQSDPPLTILAQATFFLVVFVIIGWQEELLARGYHLQTITSGINLFWGVVISSVIFGLLHLDNPNAAWTSALGIFFAGLFLAYGYLRTGQLWLSIGLHIGWNFFEGIVFGFPVSGLTTYPLLHITVNGPSLWTGGAFGPEAGLIVLPAIAIGALLIYLYGSFSFGKRSTSPEWGKEKSIT